MDPKWDRIKQFSTGDACPSTNSLLDSAEMQYRGPRKGSVKGTRSHEDSSSSTHQTPSALEQVIFNAMDDQRFAFESLIKSNSQKLNHIAESVFGELRACKSVRESMEKRLNMMDMPRKTQDILYNDAQQGRKQYLLERQADLRRQEYSLKRDIESSRSAIEMLVLVGGTDTEFMDTKLQKLIDIRQDSIDRADKELYGIEGFLEDISRELEQLSHRPAVASQLEPPHSIDHTQTTPANYVARSENVF